MINDLFGLLFPVPGLVRCLSDLIEKNTSTKIFLPSEINVYRHFGKFFKIWGLTLVLYGGTIISSKQNTAENTGRKQEETNMAKKDIYEIITDRILEQLEKGIIPWHKPWTGGKDGAYNYVTGKAYSVLNQMILSHADAYLTFKQIQDLGGKLNKGAKSEIVTFWKVLPIEDTDKEGNKVIKKIPFLRYYNVFWIGDTEGIERKDIERNTDLNPEEDAENIINLYMNSENHPALVRDNVSDRAYYSPSFDRVVVPEIGQFDEISEYYSTLFHELTHSTGYKTRLNRLSNTAFFGNEEYSKEELVAEIGAATLVNIAGLETPKSFNNSAAYIEGWSSQLRENKRMIVEASSKANKAVNYILGKKETAEA